MKRHYEALDGLRGIAAISVLLFHLGHWLSAGWLARNSWLAVDLFFCLSGFVLPIAYWHRRESLTLWSFLRIRAIRLMPLIVLGTLVSASYVILKIRAQHLAVSAGSVALATAGSLFNIPTFGAPAELGGPMVFPLNGPQYSLFLELAINIAWWALRKRSQPWLIGGTIGVCAVLVCILGLGGDTERTFIAGFPRVGLSFSLGLMLYHLRDRYTPSARTNAALFAAAGLATAALFYFPGNTPFPVRFGWIVLVVPLLVISGTRFALGPRVRATSLLFGALSYPIYVLHYPIFCWVNGIYRSRFGAHSLFREGPLILAAVTVGSYLALTFLDEPVRRALRRRSQRGAPAPFDRHRVDGTRGGSIAPAEAGEAAVVP